MPQFLNDAIANYTIEGDNLSPLISEAAFASAYYPHKKAMKNSKYETKLRLLQIELLKLQQHVRDKGLKLVVLFEGRDAAGKGGAIARVIQHMNPRSLRVVALTKPTEAEKAQNYFERYKKHLPYAGEMVIYDRSWYNRAVVEPVMGFCTPEQTESFLKEVPAFEQSLLDEGIILVKIWLHVGHMMQLKRLHKRYHDPLSRWKISPVDLDGLKKWDQFTHAIETMLPLTDQPAPWTIIHSNDKNRTRLAVIRLILSRVEYAGKDKTALKKPSKITLTTQEFMKAGGEE